METKLTKQQAFLTALAQGKSWALKKFYLQLVAAKNDKEFWQELSNKINNSVCCEINTLSELPKHLNNYDYTSFIKTTPAYVLMIFMLLALLFSSCKEQETKLHPIKKLHTIPNSKTEESLSKESKKDSLKFNYLTTKKIRDMLNKYIIRAQLPVAEKRRLKAIVRKTKRYTLLKDKKQLSNLFSEKNPKKIAEILEQMVIFQNAIKPAYTKPKPILKYKGINFIEEKKEKHDTLKKEPNPVPPYKGVNFL